MTPIATREQLEQAFANAGRAERHLHFDGFDLRLFWHDAASLGYPLGYRARPRQLPGHRVELTFREPLNLDLALETKDDFQDTGDPLNDCFEWSAINEEQARRTIAGPFLSALVVVAEHHWLRMNDSSITFGPLGGPAEATQAVCELTAALRNPIFAESQPGPLTSPQYSSEIQAAREDQQRATRRLARAVLGLIVFVAALPVLFGVYSKVSSHFEAPQIVAAQNFGRALRQGNCAQLRALVSKRFAQEHQDGVCDPALYRVDSVLDRFAGPLWILAPRARFRVLHRSATTCRLAVENNDLGANALSLLHEGDRWVIDSWTTAQP